MDDKKIVFNVSSKDQRDGITAGIVNISSNDRHLDDHAKEQLAKLSQDENIIVIAIMGDPEAFQLANEVLSYLKESGFNANGVDHVMYAEPIVGQLINKRQDNGKMEIIIGKKP